MTRSNGKMSTGIYISHIHQHVLSHRGYEYIKKNLLPWAWPQPLNDL